MSWTVQSCNVTRQLLRQPGPTLRRRRYRSGDGPGGRVGFVILCLERGDQRGPSSSRLSDLTAGDRPGLRDGGAAYPAAARAVRGTCRLTSRKMNRTNNSRLFGAVLLLSRRSILSDLPV